MVKNTSTSSSSSSKGHRSTHRSNHSSSKRSKNSDHATIHSSKPSNSHKKSSSSSSSSQKKKHGSSHHSHGQGTKRSAPRQGIAAASNGGMHGVGQPSQPGDPFYSTGSVGGRPAYSFDSRGNPIGYKSPQDQMRDVHGPVNTPGPVHVGDNGYGPNRTYGESALDPIKDYHRVLYTKIEENQEWPFKLFPWVMTTEMWGQITEWMYFDSTAVRMPEETAARYSTLARRREMWALKRYGHSMKFELNHLIHAQGQKDFMYRHIVMMNAFWFNAVLDIWTVLLFTDLRNEPEYNVSFEKNHYNQGPLLRRTEWERQMWALINKHTTNGMNKLIIDCENQYQKKNESNGVPNRYIFSEGAGQYFKMMENAKSYLISGKRQDSKGTVGISKGRYAFINGAHCHETFPIRIGQFKNDLNPLSSLRCLNTYTWQNDQTIEDVHWKEFKQWMLDIFVFNEETNDLSRLPYRDLFFYAGLFFGWKEYKGPDDTENHPSPTVYHQSYFAKQGLETIKQTYQALENGTKYYNELLDACSSDFKCCTDLVKVYQTLFNPAKQPGSGLSASLSAASALLNSAEQEALNSDPSDVRSYLRTNRVSGRAGHKKRGNNSRTGARRAGGAGKKTSKKSISSRTGARRSYEDEDDDDDDQDNDEDQDMDEDDYDDNEEDDDADSYEGSIISTSSGSSSSDSENGNDNRMEDEVEIPEIQDVLRLNKKELNDPTTKELKACLVLLNSLDPKYLITAKDLMESFAKTEGYTRAGLNVWVGMGKTLINDELSDAVTRLDTSQLNELEDAVLNEYNGDWTANELSRINNTACLQLCVSGKEKDDEEPIRVYLGEPYLGHPIILPQTAGILTLTTSRIVLIYVEPSYLDTIAANHGRIVITNTANDHGSRNRKDRLIALQYSYTLSCVLSAIKHYHMEVSMNHARTGLSEADKLTATAETRKKCCERINQIVPNELTHIEERAWKNFYENGIVVGFQDYLTPVIETLQELVHILVFEKRDRHDTVEALAYIKDLVSAVDAACKQIALKPRLSGDIGSEGGLLSSFTGARRSSSSGPILRFKNGDINQRIRVPARQEIEEITDIFRGLHAGIGGYELFQKLISRIPAVQFKTYVDNGEVIQSQIALVAEECDQERQLLIREMEQKVSNATMTEEDAGEQISYLKQSSSFEWFVGEYALMYILLEYYSKVAGVDDGGWFELWKSIIKIIDGHYFADPDHHDDTLDLVRAILEDMDSDTSNWNHCEWLEWARQANPVDLAAKLETLMEESREKATEIKAASDHMDNIASLVGLPTMKPNATGVFPAGLDKSDLSGVFPLPGETLNKARFDKRKEEIKRILGQGLTRLKGPTPITLQQLLGNDPRKIGTYTPQMIAILLVIQTLVNTDNQSGPISPIDQEVKNFVADVIGILDPFKHGYGDSFWRVFDVADVKGKIRKMPTVLDKLEKLANLVGDNVHISEAVLIELSHWSYWQDILLRGYPAIREYSKQADQWFAKESRILSKSSRQRNNPASSLPVDASAASASSSSFYISEEEFHAHSAEVRVDLDNLFTHAKNTDGRYYWLFMHHDKKLPISLLEFREASYLMGSMIACNDKDLGVTLYHQPASTMGTDANIQVTQGTISMYAQAVLRNRRQVVRVPDVFCLDYYGGNGVTKLNLLVKNEVSTYTGTKPHDARTRKSIIVVAQPMTKRYQSELLDKTGVYPCTLNPSPEEEAQCRYPACELIPRVLGWVHPETLCGGNKQNASYNSIKPPWTIFLNRDNQPATLSHQAVQHNYCHATKLFSTVTQEAGHWGPDVGRGSGSKRKADFIIDTTPMIVSIQQAIQAA